MDADRRPHVGLALGHRHGRLRGRHVGPDRDHPPDARAPARAEHGVEIARELGEVQVRVRVEEIGSGHMAPRTVAAFFTSRAFTHRIAA